MNAKGVRGQHKVTIKSQTVGRFFFQRQKMIYLGHINFMMRENDILYLI